MVLILINVLMNDINDMNKKRRQVRQLLSCLPVILLLGCPAVIAADAKVDSTVSSELVADRQNYEAQLADLESQFGPYDRSLLEPLQSLTDLATTDADFERVAELQNRQLQVMRTVLGFRHPDLIPLLQDIVSNDIRLQKWEQISDHLEHMHYLITGDEAHSTAAILEVMKQQAYWYLARVYLDQGELRARNFMKARQLSSDMLELAEAEFGEDSEAMIPWLYQTAMTEYRLVELLNADDGIASDTIDRLIQEEGVARLQLYRGSYLELGNRLGNNNLIPIVEGDEIVGEAYMRDAQNAVKSIGEIAETKGDLEAQGMALIYEGDMQRVMQLGTAFRKYRDARELLLEAEIPDEKIEQFFNQPAIIPYPELFLTLDAALAFQQASMQGIDNYESGQVHLGLLTAWQKGVPNVPEPDATAAFLNVDLVYHYADATLSISSSGKVSSVEVIAAYPAESSAERESWRALREIQVRPAIVNGRAKRTRDIHIRYRFLAEN